MSAIPEKVRLEVNERSGVDVSAYTMTAADVQGEQYLITTLNLEAD